MAPKRPARRRHIPQRTCIGCRTVLAKKELVRIVRTPDGVMIDPSGRQAGRGAYIHNQRSCWQKALGGAYGGGMRDKDRRSHTVPLLASALKAEITEQDLERLRAYSESLPE
jgi:hypothetical protein